MENVNKQTLLLEKTLEKATDLHNLDDSFNVTQFKTTDKHLLLTVDNGDSELTVKFRGKTYFEINREVTRILIDLGLLEEEDEEELD